jgi:hypothetical protein
MLLDDQVCDGACHLKNYSFVITYLLEDEHRCRKGHPYPACASLAAAAARPSLSCLAISHRRCRKGPSPGWLALTAAAVRAPHLPGCCSQPLPRGPPLPFLAVAHRHCRKGRGRANLISTGGERGSSSPQAASVDLRLHRRRAWNSSPQAARRRWRDP